MDACPGLWMMLTLDAAEEASYDLHDVGALAVEERDGTTMSSSPQTDRVLLIAGFSDTASRDRAMDELGRQYPHAELSAREIEDDGWSEGWKRFFRPVILSRLRVVTPWMEEDGFGGITVVIDPAQAFGTGGHATTRLVLAFLEEIAIEQTLPRRILDVGAGSGVLAIAAARLGAREVTAVDIDPLSTEATLENARRNEVEDRIVAQTTVPSQLRNQWPLVLANIQLAVFQNCAMDLCRCVAAGGRLVISGILVEQQARCLSLWPEFEKVSQQEKDGWLAFLLRKRSP